MLEGYVGMMKLLKFRVTNFRSVEDSGWIDVDNVTALIGTNESGKTNLLLPLWKLHPAKDGAINPIADYPRKRYNEIRSMTTKPVFIEADFELSDDIATQIAEIAEVAKESVRHLNVKRDLNGNYFIKFPDAKIADGVSKDKMVKLLSNTYTAIKQARADQINPDVKKKSLDILAAVQDSLSALPQDTLNVAQLNKVREQLKSVNTKVEPSTDELSAITMLYSQMLDEVEAEFTLLTKPLPGDIDAVKQDIINNLPSFVYYSNYGNLDSEIYLPHVIQNMQRSDLGVKEEAKARTLKVLFEFVNLSPEEIHLLGQELDPRYTPNLTQQQIDEFSEKKKEREILLQSASTELTKKFRAWWKQGDYRFRFQADGNFFRIWVSDDRRPEEIELEGRSTGLQWFLSFFLVFLVERTDTHKDAILLLDEPGLSLHPIAQEDLSFFFESLSETNQLIYTTHSPFMVDPDHLDRVKVVYINTQGETVVSSNLRANETNPAQSQSIYPVHAALGLSVSKTMLQGCQSIIVEGQADQYYLSAIKNYLISKGLLTPKYELLFMPAGGVKGIVALSPIVTAKNEEAPFVILDSDKSGQDIGTKLRTSLYQGRTERIIMVGDLLQLPGAEIEDLFPQSFLADIVTRYLPRMDEDFSDEVVANRPIVPQIEAYASKNNLSLEPGWKVQIAKAVKTKMLKSDPLRNNEAILEIWKTLFEKISSEATVAVSAEVVSR
jgi:hypothetical protein